MLITAREAARRLEDVGVTRRQTRRVLEAGFAGPPQITRSSVLYDEARVDDLAARPRISLAELDAMFPWGVFVARRDLDVRTPCAHLLEQVRHGWEFSVYTCVWIRLRVVDRGHVPLVATTCGFVALGADITGIRSAPDHQYTLDLEEPGEWFGAVRGSRIMAGPGRPWVFRTGAAGSERDDRGREDGHGTLGV